MVIYRDITVKSSKLPVRRTAKDVLSNTELAELERFRLDRRWSYREFAEAISEFLGVRMPEPTLTKALTMPGPLLATTAHPIRKYLEQHIRVEGLPRRQAAAR
jgi:hypothetical protein